MTDCHGWQQAGVLDGCVEENTDAGDRLVITWTELEPEEDPGSVDLAVIGSDQVVGVSMSGATVKGDPREEGSLSFDFQNLVDIAEDPGVGLTTTPDLIAAGDDISDDVWLDCYGQGNGTTC